MLITISGAAVTIHKYLDERSKDRRINLKGNLTNLASLNPSTLRISIIEICKYEEFYHESIPILLAFYLECNDSIFNLIEKDIRQSISTIGTPFLEYLEDYTEKYNSTIEYNNNTRVNKLLIEFLRINRLLKKPLSLSNLNIYNGKLSNLVFKQIQFSNVYFKAMDFTSSKFDKCTFSDVTFENCTLWKSSFSKNNEFNEIKFKSCNLQDTKILTSCKMCNLTGCNVLNMSININDEKLNDHLIKCQHVNTIKTLHN